MTREEIISGLRMTMELIQFDPATGNVRPIYTLNDLDKTTYLACKEAIEALKAQDVAETNVGNNGDTIYRQAAIDAPVKMVSEGLEWIPVYHIKGLPSAQQEEDCETCKHGYFGDDKCNNCRVRYPSHYERRTDESD